jgi:hypothetical protein
MMTFLLRRFAVSRLFPTIGFQIIIEAHSTEDPPGLEIDKCLAESQTTDNPVKSKHYSRRTHGRERLEPASSMAVRRPGGEVARRETAE